MKRRTAQDTWTARLILLACFLVPVAPVQANKLEPTVPTSEFSGKLLGTDGQPASGVEFMTYHLATGELFSATTAGKGTFTLLDLPYGYYDMAVRSGDGLYVADQVANVSAIGKNVVQLRLQTLSPSARADLRAFPGADIAPIGIAVLIDQRFGESFWRSPKGISLFAGGGALVLLLIGGDSGEPGASPFAP